MAQIEVEHRAMISKEKYDELLEFLKSNAEDLGEDDKTTYFFILPDKLLKVVDNISKKSAKIVLKLTKIGHGSDFEEIEIPIAPKDADQVADIFKILGFTDVHKSFQKRQNFIYKGVELAIKYSKVWRHHVELEIMIDDMSRKAGAEEKIKAVAKELGLRLMSQKELKEFTEQVEEEFRKKRMVEKNEPR